MGQDVEPASPRVPVEQIRPRFEPSVIRMEIRILVWLVFVIDFLCLVEYFVSLAFELIKHGPIVIILFIIRIRSTLLPKLEVIVLPPVLLFLLRVPSPPLGLLLAIPVLVSLLVVLPPLLIGLLVLLPLLVLALEVVV